ncbi:MAG TPA: hypothetical protein VFV88_11970 [Steroidobacteraceae bacterium]|jgi:hypothetical protein|nr:hypothetical protein [Steroidobacteraceae bacterium]
MPWRIVARMAQKPTYAQLELAERHVAEGAQHLARQHALIAELARDGHDTTTALELLRTFEQAQANHIENRDRIRAEMSTRDDE